MPSSRKSWCLLREKKREQDLKRFEEQKEKNRKVAERELRVKDFKEQELIKSLYEEGLQSE
ncbi:MAG: hypothetical protein E7379_02210 [Clostridiales bacterium]|nr:hypothetical protein [Clostridiales bacterium]